MRDQQPSAVAVETNYNLLYRWLSDDNDTTSALVNEIGGGDGALVAI